MFYSLIIEGVIVFSLLHFPLVGLENDFIRHFALAINLPSPSVGSSHCSLCQNLQQFLVIQFIVS